MKIDNMLNEWNRIKIKTNDNRNTIGYSQYEIIFMKMGYNIGYEQNGKGKEFLRPVLVYKKFNNRVFLGIPLTSKEKKDKFHCEFEYKKGKKSYAILSQIRLFDIKRAKYKDGKISTDNFQWLQNKLLDLVVTPLQKKGERTKAICKSIIPQNNTDVNNIFETTKIKDVVVINSKVHGDNRGYFVETYRQDKLEDFLGFKIDFCQDNESKSSKGVLRGLHYQLPPFAQTKLVRVIQGSVLDVAVDIRKGSPTFGEHIAIELSATNKKQLLVPRGFAHGFVVLEDDTIFAYKVDNFYNQENDRGIAYDDKDLDIDWVLNDNELNLSSKDKKQPKLKDSNELFQYGINLYG